MGNTVIAMDSVRVESVATTASTHSTADRITLGTMIVGAIAIVLLSLPYKAFDLDRFFVPKELVLHATALFAGLMVLVRRPRPALTRIDTFLLAFIALSLVSTLFAENWWLGTRALAITASGITVFWVARALAAAGYERALITGLAGAIVAGAVTALLQAYGIEPEYVSLSRAPGGTFGNRNFMAHLSAIGTPIILLCALESRRAWGFALGTAGMALVAAALVLSRSRAAWLALIVGGALMVMLGWRMLDAWTDPVRRRRLTVLAGSSAAAVVLALVLPNALEWKSESPYLDSVRGVVNYKEGSGAGRLVQYRNSFKMALAHPVLGVGPGNWSVEYPKFASRNDPSLNDEGMTSNPWPSSDWVAFVAERGVVAVVAYVLALVGLLVGAWMRARAGSTPHDRLGAVALAATVVIASIVGAFDAVLMIAIPSLFLWSIVGALSPSGKARAALPAHTRGPVIGVAAVFGVMILLRASGQIAAMSAYTAATTTTQASRAAMLDPGSYRIAMRLAQAYASRGDCAHVRQYAGAARELYPNAPEPKRLLRRCSRT
ncbi:MAG TPA: O-antigen ligase family protein [Gemmatimonadaceae bacterium]|nr:O-antigen ligase family protein [Gemmatimonadaceae bacterium]